MSGRPLTRQRAHAGGCAAGGGRGGAHAADELLEDLFAGVERRGVEGDVGGGEGQEGAGGRVAAEVAPLHVDAHAGGAGRGGVGRELGEAGDVLDVAAVGAGAEDDTRDGARLAAAARHERADSVVDHGLKQGMRMHMRAGVCM